MSAADSFLGATVFGHAYPAIMATTAAANQAKTLVEQGASDGQIIIGALSSGLIEMATERFSIGNFLDNISPTSWRQFFKEMAKQGGIEASEEVMSEVLNKISDEAIRGSMSEFNQLVRKYQAEGMSKKQAQAKAFGSAFKDVVEAGIGGLISGGFMGGVGGLTQMHKFNNIGTSIVNNGETDLILLAAESMGKLSPEIAGQVDALKKNKKILNSNGKANATYKRMLGKVAATTAQNATQVKQNVIESAVKNELQKNRVDSKVVNKVTKIVGKYLTAQQLSSAEQGYLKHNAVASSVVQEISAAQEQVKGMESGSLPQSTSLTAPSSEGAVVNTGEGYSVNANLQSNANNWAVSLANQLNVIDSAVEAVNVAVTGKSKADMKTEETNRMIKLLSIASGKTTAEQEAEAGSIPYSQYIKQKEAEQNKNTAENSGADGENSAEASSMGGVDGENITTDDMYADSFSDEKRAKKRERVETLADKLGLKLSWSSEVTEGKYNPKTREVTLNPNLTAGRMYMFIFKHEFVHDLENRKGYKSFKNYLFNISKTFVDYCETELLNKYGIQASGKDAVAILTDKVYDAWTTSEELSDNEKAAFDKEAAEREIVCNYVADRLLGGLREGGDYEQESYDALIELADTHRNIFQRFVDWVKDIINMIKGEPTFNDMADELQYLNERLAKVYDSRINFQNMTEFGFKHNISKNVDNVSFKEDRYFQSLVNRWQTLTHGAFVKVGKINENHPLVKVGMPSGELRYDVSKLKKNMSDHSDYLDKELLLAIPEIIAEPIAITQYSQSNTVSVFGNCFVGKSPMMVGITISKDRAGNDITKVRTYNARRDVANLISDESILYLCENKKRTQKWFQACGIQVPLGETKFGFIRSITQSFEKIKDNSDISNSHSIAAPINEETKANNRKKYADALKKRYGGEIDSTELKNYFKRISNEAENGNYYDAFEIAHRMARYISENSAKTLKKAANDKVIIDIFNSFFTKNKKITNSAKLEKRLSKAAELLIQSKIEDGDEDLLSKADGIIEKLAREVIEAPDENSAEYKKLQEIKETLSMARIQTTDEIKAGEFEAGFEGFKRLNRGKIWFSKNGTDVSQVYEALTKEFGEELFPSNIEGDVAKLIKISKVINKKLSADGKSLENVDDTIEKLKTEIHVAVDKIIKDMPTDESVEPESNLAEKLFDMAVYDRTEEMSNKAKEAQNKFFEKKIRELNAAAETSNAEKRRLANMDKKIDEIVKAELEVREMRQDKQKDIEAIRKSVNRLYKKLTTNSNTKHIPEGFKDAVTELCEIFYRSDRTPFDRRDFHTLKNMYDELQVNKGAELAADNAFDPEVSNMIKQVAETMNGRKLSELDYLQVALLRDIIDNISHIINEEDKIMLAGQKYRVEELGRKALKDFDGKKRAANKGFVEWSRNFFRYNNLTPVYFFEKLGGVFNDLFGEVRKGMEKIAANLDFTKDYITKVKEKYNYDSWKEQRIAYKTVNGVELNISIEQAMHLYATAKRELTNKIQNSKHIFGGGVVFTNGKTFKEALKHAKEKETIAEKIHEHLVDEIKDTAIQITFFDIAELSAMLSEEQINYINDMVKYMSENMAALGNETSMQLYGIRKYNEDFYIPYNTEQDYIASQPGYKPPKTHQNASFTKNTVKGANTPLVIENFSDVMARHCNQMIMYNALTVPLNNLTKVYNYSIDVGDEKNISKSLKSVITSTMGKGATKYIEKFIEDMNGDARSASGEELSAYLLRVFKANAVMASASVILQQPASIGRAMAYIEPKYFFGAKADKGGYEQLKKYCGAAIFKEMGRFDTGTGLSTTQWLLATKPKGLKNKAKAILKNESGYRDDLFMSAASKADELTWSAIWKAAKNKVAAETDLKVGSEEFFERAGEIASEVFDKTQVYDTTISRSQIMRSTSLIVRMATAFMAEPTVTLNMIYDAAADLKNGNKKAALSKLSSVVFTAILTAFLKSFVTAARDDDEDKSYIEKYLSDLVTESFDNMFVFNMIPYIRDVMSIIQGYDVKRSDMEAVSKLVDAVRALFDADEGFGKRLDDVLGAVGAFSGVPYKNISRDIQAVWNTSKSFIEGENKTTWDGVWYAILEDLQFWSVKDSKSTNYNRLYDAAEDGNTEKYEKVYEHLEELGADEDTIRTGLKKAVKENSEEYKDEFQEYMNKLYKTAFFSNLDDDDKKNVESNISNYIAEEIATDISDIEPSKAHKNTKKSVEKAEKKGVSLEYYYLAKAATSDKNADGPDVASEGKDETANKKEKLAAIYKMDIPTDIKAALIALYK